jgi:hypothetical protein
MSNFILKVLECNLVSFGTENIYVCRCKCRALILEGGFEFMKYAINIEKASIHISVPSTKGIC